MKAKRLIALLITLLLLIAVIPGCGAKKAEKIVVNETTHSVFYAPFYAAISLGYFKELGIEIELVNGGGSDKSMTAVLSGQAQIGLLGPEAAIYVQKEGKEDNVIFFAQVTKRDGSFLMGRKANPNFKWSDLKGKYVIGGRKGGVPEMALEYVLRKNGLEPGKDVTVDTAIQFNLMAGAFEGGTGDYVTMFEPTASQFQKAGKAYILAAVGAESGEVPYTGLVAKQSYIKSNAAMIEKITKALYKGQQWIKTASDQEVAAAIKQFFPDTDDASLMAVSKSYKSIDAWMDNPVMKEEAFNRLQDIMQQAGQLDKRVEFAKVVDNTFAQKVISQK